MPAGYAWVDLAFGVGGEGLALGHEGGVMKTTDGGERWSLQPHEIRVLMTALAHVSGKIYLAVGHGGHIYRTRDAGDTWEKIPSKSGRTLTGVSVLKGGEVLACGFEGVCLSSADDGATWSKWREWPAGQEKMHVTAQAVSSAGHLALAGVGQVLVMLSLIHI